MAELKGGSLIRSILVWIGAVVWTGIACFAALPFALLRRRRLVHGIVGLWGRGMAAMGGIKVEVENLDNLLLDDPVLYLANHQSLLDIVAFCTFLRRPFGAMAKVSLFRIPVFGSIMHGAGCIPVDRSDRKKSLHSLMEAAAFMKSGANLMVFPEGTRSKDESKLLSFKKGAFFLAKKAEVAIQPITIFGANRLLPPRQKRLIPRFRPGIIRAVIHPVLQPVAYESLNVDELCDQIYKTIDRPLLRLKQMTDALES